MSWLERLRTLEKTSHTWDDQLQKLQEAPFYSFCSTPPQEDKVFRPVDWTAGVARLRTMIRPKMIRPDRWQQAVTDARRFLDQWAAQATALGWGTLDIYGAHPTHPVERVDFAGLVLLLHSDELVAMTAETAHIRARSGAVTTYYRRADRSCAVALWAAGAAVMTAFTFDNIKALAAQLRWKSEDLIALSEDNDPFFCGRPSHRAVGEWFAALWERFGFMKGVHLRRVHYVLVSQKEPVLLPHGTPYLNTDKCWKYLVQASKPARYLGLVPLDAFVDRRNPPAQLFASGGMVRDSYITPWVTHGRVDQARLDPPTPSFDLPGYSVTGGVEQRYHVELWAEKSTMNDVLVPLCQQHGVNLITGLGEMSIPAVGDLIRRIASTGKAARVLYISDHDPGGKSMPQAVARKAEWLIAHDGLDLDLRLRPIVLTAEQIAEFNLPRTPIKETERRRTKFEKRHGVGAVELDALEALHPGELGKIVLGYHDNTLQRRLTDARLPAWRALMPIERQVHARHEDSIARLRAEYRDIAEQLDEWLQDAKRVQGVITMDLQANIPEIETVRAPEPAVADEPEALLTAGGHIRSSCSPTSGTATAPTATATPSTSSFGWTR